MIIYWETKNDLFFFIPTSREVSPMTDILSLFLLKKKNIYIYLRFFLYKCNYTTHMQSRENGNGS